MDKNETEEIVDAPKGSTVLEEIKKENIEMQSELQKREELIKHREELRAREMIAGKSQAGTAAPVVESPQDYAKRILRGGK